MHQSIIGHLISILLQSGDCICDRFWYFTPNELGADTIAGLQQDGYQVTDYGLMQLSQYPFYLYYIEAVQPAPFAKLR